MAGQAVDNDHPDPAVEIVHAAVLLTSHQVGTERADLDQRLGMVEREKFVGNLAGAGQVEAIQARAHLITLWRPQTRPEQGLEPTG